MNYYDIPTYMRKESEKQALEAIRIGIPVDQLSNAVKRSYMNILDKNNLTFKN